jgi:hypothetical protein
LQSFQANILQVKVGQGGGITQMKFYQKKGKSKQCDKIEGRRG